MARILLSTILLLIPAFVFADDFEADFQKAVSSSGAEYVPFRDVLVSAATDDYLKKKSESDDYRERIVAMAVQGWKQHGQLYKERTTAKTFVSKPSFVLFDWSRDQSAMRDPNMMPLAIEMLLKDSAGEPGRFAGQRIITTAARTKKFHHHDLLFEYFSNMPPALAKSRTAEDKEKDPRSDTVQDRIEPAVVVAMTIVGLPVDQVPTERVVATLYKIGEHEDRYHVTNVGTALGNSFLRASSQLSPAQQQELMTTLTSEDQLLGAIGSEAALRAAGGIGGPVAAEALSKYLREGEGSTDEKEVENRLWVFQLLMRMRDGSGIEPLKQYVLDAKMPARGREMALELIVGVKYSDDVRAAVTSVLEDSAAPASVRFAALRALDQLLKINFNRPEIAGQIRTAIVSTSFSPDEASGYQAGAQQIKDSAKQSK